MGVSDFSLLWPVDGGHIAAPFNPATGIVTIAATTGTTIKAGAAGLVVLAEGNTVQVSTGVFTVIYGNLQNLQVQNGQQVAAGAAIGESAGPDSIHVIVLQVVDPTPMFPAQSDASNSTAKPAQTDTSTPAPQPSQTDTSTSAPQSQPAPTPPTPTPVTKLYATPTQDHVRIRAGASTTADILSQVDTGAILEVIEAADAAHKKFGVKNSWVNVKTLYGMAGFSSGEFLKEYTGAVPTAAPTPYGAVNITGMNLDVYNPLGKPAPDRIKGMGWIRVKFNVSMDPNEPDPNKRYGHTDINAAFNRMKPFLQPYTSAGVKVLIVLTHQLYGEGAGYNWDQMDTGRWNDFIPKYADFAKRTAAIFLNTGLVHAFQIWNEQDTEPHTGRAAVPISAVDYANMLTQTIRAIRSVDANTPIITGGHVRGAGIGGQYARDTLKAMPADVRPDGIAAHPYGLGAKGNIFSNNGSLEDAIKAFSAVMPGKPIWFTEWGVLDKQGDLSVANDVSGYASSFMSIIKNQYPGQVAAAMWYAWADGMDNGYGLVDQSDKPKDVLYKKFLSL